MGVWRRGHNGGVAGRGMGVAKSTGEGLDSGIESRSGAGQGGVGRGWTTPRQGAGRCGGVAGESIGEGLDKTGLKESA